MVYWGSVAYNNITKKINVYTLLPASPLGHSYCLAIDIDLKIRVLVVFTSQNGMLHFLQMSLFVRIVTTDLGTSKIQNVR